MQEKEKFDGREYVVGSSKENSYLTWAERKPKKSKQFATSVNCFVNYMSFC